MKKKNTPIIVGAIFVAFIIAVIASLFIGLHITKINLTNAAIDYLCEKYDADENEFELVDYERGKYYIDRTIFFEIKWSSYKWKYRFNDIVFNVERIDKEFYDDYQLNDLYNWTAEYVKENVSEEIVGIKISSDMIYLHKNMFDAYRNTQSNGFNQNKCWHKNEINEFWKNHNIYRMHVYVNSMENAEMIAESISNMVNYTKFVVICLTDNSTPERINYDSEGVVCDSMEIEYYDTSVF